MDKIEQCAKLIKDAKNILVLTGAGMSTESGIPDFRSQTGLYQGKFQNINPEVILSLSFFKSNPKTFWEFMKTYMNWTDIKPNIGHEILSKWQHKRKNIAICTQNIDQMHSMSGSNNVIEVHGTLATATCQNNKCNKKYNFSEVVEKEDGYICKCGGYIKPDIVLYEEAVDKMSLVSPLINKSDLLIVLGTSLNVYPVAQIPLFFQSPNKHIIIINKTPTPYANTNNCIEIHKSIGETLGMIDKAIEQM